MVQEYRQALLEASRSVQVVAGVVEELRGYVAASSALLAGLASLAGLQTA